MIRGVPFKNRCVSLRQRTSCFLTSCCWTPPSLSHGPAYPMEVFGMKTSEYLARRQAKAAYYDRTFGTIKPGVWTKATNLSSLSVHGHGQSL